MPKVCALSEPMLGDTYSVGIGMRSASAQSDAPACQTLGNCLSVTLTAVPSMRLFSTSATDRTVASTARVTGRIRSSVARTLRSPA